MARFRYSRISNEEYLARYEREVRGWVALYRWSPLQPGGDALRIGHLAYIKGDGDHIGQWGRYVHRLQKLDLWRGSLWVMSPDGSWRRWSPYRLLDEA